MGHITESKKKTGIPRLLENESWLVAQLIYKYRG